MFTPHPARPRATLVLAVVAACALGCQFTLPYTPRPSPRIQVAEGRLAKDGQLHDFSELGALVQGNPAAEREARAYKHATTGATVLDTIGVVTDLAGLVGVVGGAATRDHTALDVGLVLALCGVDFLLFGNLATRDAHRHLTNAASIYNDGLPPEALVAPGPWPVPAAPSVPAPLPVLAPLPAPAQ